MSFQSKRINNVAILKKYSENKYRLVVCKSLPNVGYENKKIVKRERGSANKEKLDNNISRAKGKVFEYALCNNWTWFATLTLDKEKYNRYDLQKFKKDLGKFINNYNRKWGSKISYLLIPELHHDGAWHMHGLFSGIGGDDLTWFDDIPNAPKKLKGKNYYSWDSYSKKFGFSSLGLIKDKEKCASYITKYISKDLNNSIKDLNAKLYYNSLGLKVAEEIKRGTLESPINEYDYENDYVKMKWYHEIPNIIIHDFIQ